MAKTENRLVDVGIDVSEGDAAGAVDHDTRSQTKPAPPADRGQPIQLRFDLGGEGNYYYDLRFGLCLIDVGPAWMSASTPKHEIVDLPVVTDLRADKRAIHVIVEEFIVDWEAYELAVPTRRICPSLAGMRRRHRSQSSRTPVRQLPASATSTTASAAWPRTRRATTEAAPRRTLANFFMIPHPALECLAGYYDRLNGSAVAKMLQARRRGDSPSKGELGETQKNTSISNRYSVRPE